MVLKLQPLFSSFAVSALALGLVGLPNDADAANKNGKQPTKKTVIPTAPTNNQNPQTIHCSPESLKDAPIPNGLAYKNARYSVVFTKNAEGIFEPVTIFESQNVRDVLPIASLAKQMVALIALEMVKDKKITLDHPIPILKESYCLPSNHHSTWNLERNLETMSLENALTHMLRISNNTMTYNVAVALAGSEENFVQLMNLKAKELEMKNTQYVTSHGLPRGNRKEERTTPEDMAIFALSIAQYYDEIRTLSNAPLVHWIAPSTPHKKPSPFTEWRARLRDMGSVFKTGTIHGCNSLLAVVKDGDSIGVSVNLCSPDPLKRLSDGYGMVSRMKIFFNRLSQSERVVTPSIGHLPPSPASTPETLENSY